MPVDRTDALGLAKAHGTGIGLFILPPVGIVAMNGAAHIVTHIAASHAALHRSIRCSIGAYCAAAGHTVGRTVADGRNEAL